MDHPSATFHISSFPCSSPHCSNLSDDLFSCHLCIKTTFCSNECLNLHKSAKHFSAQKNHENVENGGNSGKFEKKNFTNFEKIEILQIPQKFEKKTSSEKKHENEKTAEILQNSENNQKYDRKKSLEKKSENQKLSEIPQIPEIIENIPRNHKENIENPLNFSIKPEILLDFEVIGQIDSKFNAIGPPFQGIRKDFIRLKRKNTGEHCILIKAYKSDFSNEILSSFKGIMGLNHPHILKLYKIYEENTLIYLLFEGFSHDTMAGYLKHKKTFMERNAFIYFVQICLAVDYLHKKHVFPLYLSLNNLLLDEKMDIKLTDFRNFTNNNESFPQSPEILLQEKKSSKNTPDKTSLIRKADMWSLGVLLYELIHGYYPYKGKNYDEKKLNIMNNNCKKLASFISDEAKDLLSNLLAMNPVDRFDLEQVFKHRWMEKFYKLFNVDIEKFLHKDKVRRSSLINERKKEISMKNEKNEKTREYVNKSKEFQKEIQPLKIFAEEFSFRLQHLKVRSSLDMTASNNFKSFTFNNKSSSPSGNSNAMIASSSLMKSSDSGGKSAKKPFLEEILYNSNDKNHIIGEKKTSLEKNLLLENNGILDKHEFLRLQKCEESTQLVESEEKSMFWKKFADIIGCGCFKTMK